MSFFSKIKQAFTSKEPPKFKTYSPSELKLIAVRTRLVLEKQQETLAKQIREEDKKFMYAGQDPNQLYSILLVLGEKVIEAESLKILMEMMRKVENSSVQIVKTNGDVALLKREIQWLQCVLWYRQKKNRTDLQQLHTFCWNFFRGIDVTTELNPHCQIFQLYPILRELPNKGPMYLPDLFQLMQPYLSCNIDQLTLDQVVNINKSDMRRLGPGEQQGHSMVHPGQYNPNQKSFVPNQPSNKGSKQYYDPHNSNPYVSKERFSHPYQDNHLSNIIPPNNYSNISPNNNYSNIRPNNYSMPNNQNQFGGNIPQPNWNNDNNTLLYHQKPSNQTNPNFNTPPPTNQTSNNFNPSSRPQYTPPKPSFLNTLLRNDNSRESIDRDPSQFGSRAPIQQVSKEQFHYDDVDETLRELDELQKKESWKKEEEQRKRREEQKQKKRKEQQEKKREQLKKQREEEEEKLKKQKEEEKRIKELEERRIKELEEKRIKELEERRVKEQEEKRRHQQERKRQQQLREREWEKSERQRQSHRLQREREMELRQSSFQLNVFRDMQREQVDRGTSGRFSTNFGLRASFNNNKEEELIGAAPQNINTLLQQDQPDLVSNPKAANPQERASLNIVMQNEGCSPARDFKLFYFKRTQQQ